MKKPALFLLFLLCGAMAFSRVYADETGFIERKVEEEQGTFGVMADYQGKWFIPHKGSVVRVRADARRLTSSEKIEGVTWPSGTQVTVYENSAGKVVDCFPADFVAPVDMVLDGTAFKQGGVINIKQGAVRRGTLVYNTDFNGLAFAADKPISFYRRNQVEHGTLAGPQRWNALRIVGEVTFGPDGQIVSAISAEPQTLNKLKLSAGQRITARQLAAYSSPADDRR